MALAVESNCLPLNKLALIFTNLNGMRCGSNIHLQITRKEGQERRERDRGTSDRKRERAGGGNKRKIKPMNELHAHYETKKPFEALSVRSSFMVKQEKASSLKR